MLILYILLVAYILAVNFYAVLLVKQLRDERRALEVQRQAQPLSLHSVSPSGLSSGSQSGSPSGLSSGSPSDAPFPDKPPQKYVGKLCITGALGGAIAVYTCMFLFKFERSNLFLMVLMPLLGVLNVYLFVLLFRSGFSFLLIR